MQPVLVDGGQFTARSALFRKLDDFRIAFHGAGSFTRRQQGAETHFRMLQIRITEVGKARPHGTLLLLLRADYARA